MSVETDFYTLLSGNGGVVAQISTRLFPDVLPETATYPAAVFARVATTPVLGLSGVTFANDVELSVGVWAKTRTASDAGADAIVAAISGTDFYLGDRSAAYDPETGLFATTLSVRTLKI